MEDDVHLMHRKTEGIRGLLIKLIAESGKDENLNETTPNGFDCLERRVFVIPLWSVVFLLFVMDNLAQL